MGNNWSRRVTLAVMLSTTCLTNAATAARSDELGMEKAKASLAAALSAAAALPPLLRQAPGLASSVRTGLRTERARRASRRSREGPLRPLALAPVSNAK